ncbi:MAG: ribonuclease M5 [Lactobacillaceae bacterium]|jgi:ribonuclease M5|nr:ribonuclease M5 [Lactobacillaceae bacterium]
MEYKQVIVVEGRSDSQKLKTIFGEDIKTVETGGSSIDRTILDYLKSISDNQEIIILTDPDFQGERIRKIISHTVPNAKHAFISKEEGQPKHKGSLGVEHASIKTIKTALEHLLTPISSNENKEQINVQQLFDLGLIGKKNSQKLRNVVAQELRIGNVNGKQLLKRLNLFHIKYNQLLEAVLNAK